MKSLYIMAAIMLVGLLMMTMASYKVISVVKDSTQAAPSGPVRSKIPGFERETAPQPSATEVLPYVTISYIGLTLFILGAAGALFAAFKAMSHRF